MQPQVHLGRSRLRKVRQGGRVQQVLGRRRGCATRRCGKDKGARARAWARAGIWRRRRQGQEGRRGRHLGRLHVVLGHNVIDGMLELPVVKGHGAQVQCLIAKAHATQLVQQRVLQAGEGWLGRRMLRRSRA